MKELAWARMQHYEEQGGIELGLWKLGTQVIVCVRIVCVINHFLQMASPIGPLQHLLTPNNTAAMLSMGRSSLMKGFCVLRAALRRLIHDTTQ